MKSHQGILFYRLIITNSYYLKKKSGVQLQPLIIELQAPVHLKYNLFDFELIFSMSLKPCWGERGMQIIDLGIEVNVSITCRSPKVQKVQIKQ